MDRFWNTTLWQQFGATIDMLETNADAPAATTLERDQFRCAQFSEPAFELVGRHPTATLQHQQHVEHTGAAQVVIDVALLRERVTSKGGTTEAALASLARVYFGLILIARSKHRNV